MAQRYNLGKGQIHRITNRIKEGHTQIEVAQDLNIPQSVISRALSGYLITGSVDRNLVKENQKK